MAFALGAVSNKTRTEMHKLKKIRNRFAHTTEKFSFRSPEKCSEASPRRIASPSRLYDVGNRSTDRLQTLAISPQCYLA